MTEFSELACERSCKENWTSEIGAELMCSKTCRWMPCDPSLNDT